jgi:hypothetical protein
MLKHPTFVSVVSCTTLLVGVGGIEALGSDKSRVILGILEETWMDSLSCLHF